MRITQRSYPSVNRAVDFIPACIAICHIVLRLSIHPNHALQCSPFTLLAYCSVWLPQVSPFSLRHWSIVPTSVMKGFIRITTPSVPRSNPVRCYCCYCIIIPQSANFTRLRGQHSFDMQGGCSVLAQQNPVSGRSDCHALDSTIFRVRGSLVVEDS